MQRGGEPYGTQDYAGAVKRRRLGWAVGAARPCMASQSRQSGRPKRTFTRPISTVFVGCWLAASACGQREREKMNCRRRAGRGACMQPSEGARTMWLGRQVDSILPSVTHRPMGSLAAGRCCHRSPARCSLCLLGVGGEREARLG
jgi:hypothetical protein